MKQTSLAIDLGSRHTRKRVFLDGMEQVVPGTQLLALIEPHAPVAKTGRPPFDLSDMAMQEALFDTPMYRHFVGLGGMACLSKRVSILRFRHLLEPHRLAQLLPVPNHIVDGCSLTVSGV
jgi:IS5 family transposase